MKAPDAFPILALMSSSVPPEFVIMLPRYVNLSKCLSACPYRVMTCLCVVLTLIPSVFPVCTPSPVFLHSLARPFVLLCMCCHLWERRHRSSAKSISSRNSVKFGHGVSYDQLEENDTALCLQKLAIGFNQRAILPVSIKPYVFTNLAWDNIDRLD